MKRNQIFAILYSMFICTFLASCEKESGGTSETTKDPCLENPSAEGCQTTSDNNDLDGTEKTDTGCAEATLSWQNETGLICEHTVATGAHADTLSLIDKEPPYVGQANISCESGTWVVSPVSCLDAPQGTQNVSLSLTANGTSRFFEYFSDAFAQIDQSFNGSDVLDGFFQISQLPAIQQGPGTGADVFPMEGDWKDVFDLSIDLTGTSGIGEETASVIGLVGDLDVFVQGSSTVLASPYTTTLSEIAGEVKLLDGVVVGIMNLNATATFTWDTSGFNGFNGLGDTLSFSGPFVVEENGGFSINVGDENPVIGGNFVTWELAGRVNGLTQP